MAQKKKREKKIFGTFALEGDEIVFQSDFFQDCDCPVKIKYDPESRDNTVRLISRFVMLMRMTPAQRKAAMKKAHDKQISSFCDAMMFDALSRG